VRRADRKANQKSKCKKQNDNAKFKMVRQAHHKNQKTKISDLTFQISEV
jgi:hypothetical protein